MRSRNWCQGCWVSYTLTIAIVVSCLSVLACSNGNGDVLPSPVDIPSQSMEEVQDMEEDETFMIPITDAEDAVFSCGDWGLGMELQETDMPMVRCMLDKSQGKEGRAELLVGMMEGAIWGANVEAVQSLLDEGVNANGPGPIMGQPFLLQAVEGLAGQNHDTTASITIAEMLIAEGARIEYPDAGYTNVWFIAVSHSYEAIRILASAGMDPNVRGPLDRSFAMRSALDMAVHRACIGDGAGPDSHELEVVRQLITAGADPNTMTIGHKMSDDGRVSGFYESNTLLADAERKGCPLVANILRDAGACPYLEGRRFDFGNQGALDDLQMLSGGNPFPPRGKIDCPASP